MKRLLILLVFPILFTQCTKSDGPKGPESDLGWIELEVSGAVNEKHSGVAGFYGQTIGETTYWQITGHDISPQTFDLNLMLMTLYEFDQPGPGQYVIGHEVNSHEVFLGIFSEVTDPIEHSIEYSTFETGGTLVLEKSNSKEVSGNFSFTAKSEEGAEIQVSGKFVAAPFQF